MKTQIFHMFESPGFNSDGNRPSRMIEIPTNYSDECALDIAEVSKLTGLTRNEVVLAHSEVEYRVQFVGFSPGFAYLEGLSPKLSVARLATPRTRVPAGSVAIAGGLAGVYPSPTPGGWRILGRTNLKMFDPDLSNPSLLQPGDRVRFVPVRSSLQAEADRSYEKKAGLGGRLIFKVADPGTFTTLQDFGRANLAHFGIAQGGAADRDTYKISNQIVGAPCGVAALEITASGPTLEACDDAWVSIAGGKCRITADRVPLPMWTAVHIRKGQRLSIGNAESGLRTYLSTRGGFDGIARLGSRSFLSDSEWSGSPLSPGDFLFEAESETQPSSVGRAVGAIRGRFESLGSPEAPFEIRFTRGAQVAWFQSDFFMSFSSQVHIATVNFNRRGIRLEPIRNVSRRSEFESRELASEIAVPGTVQIGPDGAPLILFADQGTTGGYPKIANVISADLSMLGQIKPGSRIRFREVSFEEAWAARDRHEKLLERGVIPI